MNKRMQKKVAKRNGGVVVQHSVATPRRKRAGVTTSARSDTHAPVRSSSPRAAARALAREVAEVVQDRAAGAVKQIKGKLARSEKRAEKLLAKVPGVGPAVAKKLHDVVGS